MGKYTGHWAEYTWRSNRRTHEGLDWLLLLLLLVVIGYAISGLGDWSTYVTFALLLVWLAGFIRLTLRSTKVTCQECATVYSRGRTLVNYPICGLRLFQEEAIT